MGTCFVYAILCFISLNGVRTSDCPSKHCNCELQNQWNCVIKKDDDNIDCSHWIIPFNITVHLELISENRNTLLFTNVDRCKIIGLRIVTNRIPSNNWIRNLNSLQILVVQGTLTSPHGFQNLDNLFWELTGLKKVKIENHPIQNWSKDILKPCNDVSEMDLKNLGLKNIETNSFDSCKRLLKLTIHFNRLSNVFTSIFNGLVELVVLTLSNNFMTNIITNGNGWWEVRKLKRLDLSYNAFGSLQPKSFIGLVNLDQLILNNNELHFIDRAAFEGLSKLSSLNLRNNPKLILFDLFVLIPMSNSLTKLHTDVSFIQCVNDKSKLNQFQYPIRYLLQRSRDCNTVQKTITETVTSKLSLYHQESVKISNFPLIIAMAVIITIFVLGVIFFLVYYCTTRKKIRQYKSGALDEMTTPSGSSRLYAPHRKMSPINCPTEPPQFFTFRNNSNHSASPMMPRYFSNPILPNHSEPMVNSL